MLSKDDETYFDDFIPLLAASVEDITEKNLLIEEISKEAKPFYQYCIESGLDRYMSLLAIEQCPSIKNRYSKSEFAKIFCAKKSVCEQ